MKDSKIKVAIIGLGNCASSLIQGLEYYKSVDENSEPVIGLMSNSFGGYLIRDIEIVAAFDVNANKVGKDIAEAVFAEPNCTKKISDVPTKGVTVSAGPILDGIAMAEEINGIKFTPLRTLLEVKNDMKREKDLKDVILIEEYLKAHPLE